MRACLPDRLLAGRLGVALGLLAHLLSVLRRLAFDLRGRSLGGVQDALDLRARRCGERRLGLTGRRARELFDLRGQRPEVRIDGRRLVPPTRDREVSPFDGLTIEVHCRES